MFNDNKVIGIIPARAGSKGLPTKNKKQINGKPLIGWSIETALKSECLDTILVSTDDEEIRDIAHSYGVEAPFLRPTWLSKDDSSTMDVIDHALDFCQQRGNSFDCFVLLEPTSPLRKRDDVDRSLAEMLKSNADAIVSVCASEDAHPAFLFTLSGQRRLNPFLGQYPTNVRRQEITEIYYPEGTVYASKVGPFLRRGTYYHENTIPYVVEKWQSFEIDDHVDFHIVEKLLQVFGDCL